MVYQDAEITLHPWCVYRPDLLTESNLLQGHDIKGEGYVFHNPFYSMSNFKVQMSNQIQSSNEMPKSLDPELSSGSGSAWQGCHSSEPCPETSSGSSISESNFEL